MVFEAFSRAPAARRGVLNHGPTYPPRFRPPLLAPPCVAAFAAALLALCALDAASASTHRTITDAAGRPVLNLEILSGEESGTGADVTPAQLEVLEGAAGWLPEILGPARLTPSILVGALPYANAYFMSYFLEDGEHAFGRAWRKGAGDPDGEGDHERSVALAQNTSRITADVRRASLAAALRAGPELTFAQTGASVMPYAVLSGAVIRTQGETESGTGALAYGAQTYASAAGGFGLETAQPVASQFADYRWIWRANLK